jgi:hypothetical protein
MPSQSKSHESSPQNDVPSEWVVFVVPDQLRDITHVVRLPYVKNKPLDLYVRDPRAKSTNISGKLVTHSYHLTLTRTKERVSLHHQPHPGDVYVLEKHR